MMNIQQEIEFWKRRLSEFVDGSNSDIDGFGYIRNVERGLNRGEYDMELTEY